MEQQFYTGGLGANHTEIVLHLNNSLGQVDLVTKVLNYQLLSNMHALERY